MGLKHASATVPFFPSVEISVHWEISKSGQMVVDVHDPESSMGVFKLGKTNTLQGKSKYTFTVHV